MIGKTIAHYHIIEKLGEGGMGVVYKAEDTRLKRPVALKFLHRDSIQDKARKARLLEEAQAAAAVNHPNICTVYEINEVDNSVFIAMEYIEGENLKEIIPLTPPLKKGDAQVLSLFQRESQRGINSPPFVKGDTGGLVFNIAINYATQIAEGLQAIHDQGMVHRDIKSDNIRITKKGQLKIMDFGLVKSVQIKDRLSDKDFTGGTIAYMAPEQIRGEEVDHRSDIWSFGIILYEMLTGQLPFQADKQGIAVVYSILDEKPEPLTSLKPGIPKRLEEIVNRALAKDRKERYQHIQEVLTDLKALKQIDKEILQLKQVPAKYRKRFKIKYYLTGFIIIITILTGIFIANQVEDKSIDSIAVLPLKDISGENTKYWFADQITDILTTELSKIKALKVISHTSMLKFKNTDKSMPEIASVLNVDGLIEGSVVYANDRIRINVQLIHGKKDEHLWAEYYESELKDVLSLQKKIARNIAEEIKGKIIPEDIQRIGTAHELDPEAFRLYALGMSYTNENIQLQFLKSIECFQKAIAIDSTFRDAYSELTIQSTFQAAWGDHHMVREIWAPVARKALKKTKELCGEDEILTYLNAKANVEAYLNWNWQEACRIYEQIIELDPYNSWSYYGYGCFLFFMGKLEKALENLERAFNLNVFDKSIAWRLARVYHAIGKLDKAIYYYEYFCGYKLDFGLDFSPRVWDLEYAYWQKSDNKQEMLEDWIKVWENKKEDEMTPTMLAGQSNVYALLGRYDEALRTVKKIEMKFNNMPWIPLAYANVYAMSGEKKKAMDYFEKMVQDSSGWVIVLHETRTYIPFYDIMYPEPEFQQLLKRVGLKE
jgi:serine/threonine protein kinase